MNKIRYLIPLLAILLLVMPARAQLNTDDTPTVTELVEDILLGEGVQVYNITSTGANRAIGSFTTLPATFSEVPMDGGVIMSTGDIADAEGPNDSGGTSSNNWQPGDPDISAILGGTATNDAAVIEFDFYSPADTVRFNYIFASEEYREYVCNFNDAFAFLLTGPNPAGGNYNKHNIALVPGTSTEVAIKTVNNGDSNSSCPEENSNQMYYVDNGDGSTPVANPNVEFDGLTDVFTAVAIIEPCEEYHIKLVVADASDSQYDSSVFLEANSFSADVDTMLADFTHEGPGCTNEDIQFLNAGSSGTGVTFEWTFGGGATPASSSAENPVVSWNTPGLKQADLKATKLKCDGVSNPVIDSAMATKYVTVYERPDADFTFTDSICAGNSVQFTNNGSSGSAFSHEWTFTADAQPSEAYTENPEIMFATPGDKPVKHTVYNDHCSHTTTDTITILPTPEADFTHTGPVCMDQGIDFTNTGTSAGVSFDWSFSPDGTPGTSAVENPTGIMFATPGLKTATLVVTDNLSGCQDSISKTFEILPVPVADFTFANNVCIGTGVDFAITSSTGNEYSYSWDFGSHASTSGSTAEDPQNISFSSSGNHTITLSVSNNTCVATTTHVLTVENSPAPEVSFTSTAPACGNDPVDFSFDGDPAGLDFDWDFGPGATTSTSTAVNPSGIVFDNNGTQTITLTVTDAGSGCWNEAQQTINIYQDPVASFDFTDSICIGASLDFLNTGSTGQEYSYTWDFGTGATPSTSSAKNPSGIKYSSGGDKIITYTVSTSNCSETLTDTVHVKNSPQPEIEFTSTAPDCENDEITFTILNYDPQFDYSWDFGADATPGTSSAQEPVVTYSSPGTKTVQLYAEHPVSGCNNEGSQTINIYDDPLASFTFTDSICIGESLDFLNAGSTGQEYSYTWDFGTGATPSTSSAENPSGITYSSGGDKIITYTVSTSNCTETLTDTVHVKNSPQPEIEFTSTAPDCENDEITFTILNYDPQFDYTWNFGAGATPPTETVSEPVVTYNSPGTKTVQLYAEHPVSGCNNEGSQTINIYDDPVASFDFTDSICIGANIDFLNTGSTGQEYSYSWDFGTDATPSTSAAEHPSGISYTSSGDKLITLTVSTPQCTESFTDTLHIRNSPAPVLDFSSTAPACEANDVSFVISDYDASLEYNWFFGTDATPPGSSNAEPVVVYSSPGVKTVTLFANNPANGCGNVISKTINIHPRPDVSFNSTAPVCIGQTVDFTNTGSSGAEYQYTWDFGENANPSTSNVENPSGIIYSSSGDKEVSLTISDGNCTRTVSQTISISESPFAEFETTAPKCAGMPVYMHNLSDTANTFFQWDFGDNATPQTSDATNPFVIYDEAGSHEIKLTVTKLSSGCKDSVSHFININPTPEAGLSVVLPDCPGEPVAFINEGSSGSEFSYQWDFGTDAIPNTSQAENPSGVIFTRGGMHRISFTIMNNECTNTMHDDITLPYLPDVDAGLDTTICANRSVQLGVPGPDDYSYNWFPSSTLDDAHVAQPVAAPEAEFTTYHVTVTDDNTGCVNSDSVNVTMLPPALAKSGPDVTICRYDSIQIGTGLIEGQSYYWYPETGVGNPHKPNTMVSPPETITYTLHASYAGCDTVTDEVKVTVHPLPAIDAGENRTIARGEQVQLNATGGVNYVWSPISEINHPYIPNPVVSPDDTITYTVTGNDVFGCENADSVTIFVNDPQFFIPNTFTPNGDDRNDVFYIRGEPLDDFELRILTRQNQCVFISNDYYQGWDGTIQGSGEACPEGAYVYIVTGINEDGEEIHKNGIVNLIR
jgi:gliding motility-associated-like protein